MQIEPRANVSILRAGLAPIVAVFAALVLCSVLIAWAGVPVIESYFLLFKGSLGSRFAITETITRSIPLMFTGLAAAIAFRAKFYNIGAEGPVVLWRSGGHVFWHRSDCSACIVDDTVFDHRRCIGRGTDIDRPGFIEDLHEG